MKLYGRTPREAAELILKCVEALNDPDYWDPNLTDDAWEKKFGWMDDDDIYCLIMDITGREPWYVTDEPMVIELVRMLDIRWTKRARPRRDDLRRAIAALEGDIAYLRYVQEVLKELLKLIEK